jgi:hypothetical protein
LLIDVTYQNKFVLGSAVESVAKLAVMVRDGLTTPPAEAWKLSARFSDPEFRSTSANADAYVKLAGANDDLKSSPVLLETVFDEDQVARIQDDRRRSRSTANLSLLASQAPTTEVVDVAATPDAV